MKLASTMHTNSIQIPFNFDFNLLKSSAVNCPRSVASRFILPRPRPLFSVSGGCGCGRNYYHLTPAFIEGGLRSRSPRRSYSIITRASKTEHEEQASTSRNDIDIGETSLRTADHASSLRTVGLCLTFVVGVLGCGIWYWSGYQRRSWEGI